MDGLTPRQQRFAELYAATGNGRQSYLQAGYKCTDAAAEVGASRALRNAKVAAYVDKLRAEAAERAGISVQGVVERLEHIYRLGVGEVVTEGVSPSLAAAATAAQLLGKHLGMFEERVRDVTPIGDINPEPDPDEWASKHAPSQDPRPAHSTH